MTVERRCSFGVAKMVICFTVIILRHLNKRRVIILRCFSKSIISIVVVVTVIHVDVGPVRRAVWLDGCYRDSKIINEGRPCKIADISS